jgi:hypothetical protein
MNSLKDFIFNNQNPTLKKNIILSLYLWVCNQLLYYTCITNLDKIDTYVSFSFEIFFYTQILSTIILIFIYEYITPIKVIYLSSILNSLNLLMLFLLNNSGIGRIIIFGFYSILFNLTIQSIYIFIPQLFQANIRASAVSYTKFPAKLLLIITPFIWGTNIILPIVTLIMFNMSIPLMLYYLYEEDNCK